MRSLIRLVALASLAGTVAPAFLLLAGRIPADAVHGCMLGSMIGWFATAPWWLGRRAG